MPCSLRSAGCEKRVGNSHLSFIYQLNELMLPSLLLVALCWCCSLLCSCHYGTSLPYWIKSALNLALSSSDLLPSRLLLLSSCVQLYSVGNVLCSAGSVDFAASFSPPPSQLLPLRALKNILATFPNAPTKSQRSCCCCCCSVCVLCWQSGNAGVVPCSSRTP